MQKTLCLSAKVETANLPPGSSQFPQLETRKETLHELLGESKMYRRVWLFDETSFHWSRQDLARMDRWDRILLRRMRN